MGELVMITAFTAFYFGAAFYVAALASIDPATEGDWRVVALSALGWPYGLYMIMKEDDPFA